MSDDDELRLIRPFPEQPREALGVGFVEGRIDLVEHAEGRWAHSQHREQQTRGRERPLPARHGRQRLSGSARGLHDNVHARLQPVSYTHLDVYKRQALLLAASPSIRKRLLPSTKLCIGILTTFGLSGSMILLSRFIFNGFLLLKVTRTLAPESP